MGRVAGCAAVGGVIPGHIDLKEGTLRLEPGTTKNDDGRLVYLTLELKAQTAAQFDRVRSLEKELDQIIPFLFVQPTACRRAGVAGRLRHDFRRTAVRNMMNKGIARNAWR